MSSSPSFFIISESEGLEIALLMILTCLASPALTMTAQYLVLQYFWAKCLYFLMIIAKYALPASAPAPSTFVVSTELTLV